MGERKVLQKYYPPDLDPSRELRVRGQKKRSRDDAQTIRMMLPFSLRCSTCGHFMRTGKKLNATKETAIGMDYLTIKRLRFRVKCEVCRAPVSFLTDPKNSDYEMESGATRNYDFRTEQRASKMAAIQEAQQEQGPKDSMQALESRMLDSRKEMDDLDALESLRRRNRTRERVGAADALAVAGTNPEAGIVASGAVLASQAPQVSEQLGGLAGSSSEGRHDDLAEVEEDEDEAVERAFAAKRSRVRRLADDSDDEGDLPLGQAAGASGSTAQDPNPEHGASKPVPSLLDPAVVVVSVKARKKRGGTLGATASAAHKSPSGVASSRAAGGLGLSYALSSSDDEE